MLGALPDSHAALAFTVVAHPAVVTSISLWSSLGTLQVVAAVPSIHPVFLSVTDVLAVIAPILPPIHAVFPAIHPIFLSVADILQAIARSAVVLTVEAILLPISNVFHPIADIFPMIAAIFEAVTALLETVVHLLAQLGVMFEKLLTLFRRGFLHFVFHLMLHLRLHAGRLMHRPALRSCELRPGRAILLRDGRSRAETHQTHPHYCSNDDGVPTAHWAPSSFFPLFTEYARGKESASTPPPVCRPERTDTPPSAEQTGGGVKARRPN
jgi:hypothetical protein